jgi:hypothetical protein
MTAYVTRQLHSWLSEKRAAADQTVASRWDIVAVWVVRIMLHASSWEAPAVVGRIHDDGKDSGIVGRRRWGRSRDRV